MSALGHYLEKEGIATTGVSLIREHTETMRPPRALWVTFELGRPLGAPDDPPFQRRVLMAALRLLERSDGPILAEFDEPAPEPADLTGWACPLPMAATDAAHPDDMAAALAREIAQLEPWYDRAVAARRRTTAGVLGLQPAEAGKFLARLLADATPDAAVSPVTGVPLADAVKHTTEDLKAYYLEAASAFPGAGSGRERVDWLWNETVFGRTLLALRPVLSVTADPTLARIATRLMIPATREPG